MNETAGRSVAEKRATGAGARLVGGPRVFVIGALAAMLVPGSAGCRAETRATSDIAIATLAVGRLFVTGMTAKPHTPVVLERRFHTVSDASGQFSFEELHHPPTCIVRVEIEEQTYRAVVGNCAQRMQIGLLPFVGADLPSLARPPSPPRPIAAVPPAPVRSRKLFPAPPVKPSEFRKPVANRPVRNAPQTEDAFRTKRSLQ